jgi:hypothetical protein
MRPWESVPATGGGGEADCHGRMDHPIGSAYGGIVAEGLTGQQWVKRRHGNRGGAARLAPIRRAGMAALSVGGRAVGCAARLPRSGGGIWRR